MSKQMRQYTEVAEQEQRELDILALLDEAYELEQQEQLMRTNHTRQISSRLATIEYNYNMAIEYGYEAA
jgi:hypothetical protein